MMTNEEALGMTTLGLFRRRYMNESRKLMQCIRKTQLELFGCIMKKNGLENLVTTGNVGGRGRLKLTCTGIH